MLLQLTVMYSLYAVCGDEWRIQCMATLAIKHKNSSGDEIANVNFCTTTTNI